jgi:chitinase
MFRRSCLWCAAFLLGILSSAFNAAFAQTRSEHGDAGSFKWNLAYFHQLDSHKANFPISAIPWSMYTHVAHEAIRPVIGPNGAPDIDAKTYRIDVNAKAFTSAAHAHHRRALISIMVGSEQVPAMKQDTAPEHIDQFVARIGQFVRKYDYDGVDVDWEAWQDKARIVSFITKLRKELPRPRYDLTFAASAYFRFTLAEVADELDQINIMCYDWYVTNYTGKMIDYAWYNTSILASPGVKMGDYHAAKSLEEEVWWFVASGKVPVNKLGILVPFYGRIIQGVTKPGDSLKGDRSTRTYISWSQLMDSKYWREGEHHWDNIHKAPYMSYYGKSPAQNAFVTYTGPRQIIEFVKWAKAKGVGGMGSFALSHEYMPEKSGDARYPLSSVLYKSIHATPAQLGAMLAKQARNMDAGH